MLLYFFLRSFFDAFLWCVHSNSFQFQRRAGKHWNCRRIPFLHNLFEVGRLLNVCWKISWNFSRFYVVKKIQNKIVWFCYFHLWKKKNYSQSKVVNNEKCCSVFTVAALVNGLRHYFNHEISDSIVFPVQLNFFCLA